MDRQSDEHLYLVCVHYALKYPRDWEWRNHHLTVKFDSVVPRLAGDLAYLRRVLEPRKSGSGRTWSGFAFIFLDPGWTSLLGGGPPLTMAALGADLAVMQADIERRLNNDDSLASSHRSERIITAHNLLHLLELLEMAARDRGDSFYRLFVGGSQALRYDAPKVVEAAIRIANNGCGLPLFRFDDDVIFYGQRSPEAPTAEGRNRAADAERENILRLCERYYVTLQNPRVRYFVFSGGYDEPDKDDGPVADNDARLLNGFATRVLQLTQLPERRDREAEDATQGHLKALVVNTFLNTLVQVGANPLRQVVSGAGLCLSDGAILDLPPFSNMHLNVMWIDDHLKYALHDELGHFGRWTGTHHHYQARVKDVRFSQLRHVGGANAPLFTYKDVRWHLRTYMLRLLLGCVADGWLRGRMETKMDTSNLAKADHTRLIESVPHLYGEVFIEVLPGGWEPSPTRPTATEFRQKLWAHGVERLRETATLWGQDCYVDTFLGLFVRGEQHPRYEEFRDYFPLGMPAGLAQAVEALPSTPPSPQSSPNDIVPDDLPLDRALDALVDDFVDYFSLVQVWPFFIQAVRCLQNQYARFRNTDLDWMFPIVADHD